MFKNNTDVAPLIDILSTRTRTIIIKILSNENENGLYPKEIANRVNMNKSTIRKQAKRLRRQNVLISSKFGKVRLRIENKKIKALKEFFILQAKNKIK